MTRKCGVAPAVLAAACAALSAFPSNGQIGFRRGAPRVPRPPARAFPIHEHNIHLPMGIGVPAGVYRTKAALDAAVAAADPRRDPSSTGHYPYGVNWDTEMVVVCPAVRGPGNQASQSIESIGHDNGTCTINVVVTLPGPEDVLPAGQPEQVIQTALAVPLSEDRIEFKTRTDRPVAARFLMREIRGETKVREDVTWLVKGDVSQMRTNYAPHDDVGISVDELTNDGKASQFRRNSGTIHGAAVDALAGAARETGFLDLKDSYGKEIRDIDQRVRLIRVSVDGRKKEVLVRDDPTDPVPLAFERMWKAFRDAKAQASLSRGSWGGGSSGGGASSSGGGGAWSSSGGGGARSVFGGGGLSVGGGTGSAAGGIP